VKLFNSYVDPTYSAGTELATQNTISVHLYEVCTLLYKRNNSVPPSLCPSVRPRRNLFNVTSLRCIFATTGGSHLHPLYVETTEKGHFPPVSQTYETSRASLTSDASHPMLTSH